MRVLTFLLCVVFALGLTNCRSTKRNDRPMVSNNDSNFYAYDIGQKGVRASFVKKTVDPQTQSSSTYLIIEEDLIVNGELILSKGSSAVASTTYSYENLTVDQVRPKGYSSWYPAQGVAILPNNGQGIIYFSRITLPKP